MVISLGMLSVFYRWNLEYIDSLGTNRTGTTTTTFGQLKRTFFGTSLTWNDRTMLKLTKLENHMVRVLQIQTASMYEHHCIRVYILPSRKVKNFIKLSSRPTTNIPCTVIYTDNIPAEMLETDAIAKISAEYL